MSNYIDRVNAFARFGPDAVYKFVNDFGELFLSISEQEVFEQIAAETRLGDDIEVPRSSDDVYRITAALLVELFQQKRVRFVHPLTTLGNGEFQRLLEFVRKGRSTEPADIYAEVILTYKNDVNVFNARRAAEPQFLEMSNKAQELGLLV
jgi:hypothetical protein